MKRHYRAAASAASGENLPNLCNMRRISEYSYTLHCRAPSCDQIDYFFSGKNNRKRKKRDAYKKYQNDSKVSDNIN